MPTWDVFDSVDILYVQKGVQKFAAELGFKNRERGELAIVGSELASNIVKYGIKGRIDASQVTDAEGTGMLLVAIDRGPPFHDLDAALQDGWSDRGPIDPMDMLKRKGIGGGLGAIRRLSHSFRVEQLVGGKKVYVIRYLKPLPFGGLK